MIRPARALPSAPPVIGTALHRRRAPVIVRAPGHQSSIQVTAADRRRRSPTLPGIGYRMEEDTIPILELVDDEPPPVSRVRTRGELAVAPTEPQPRVVAGPNPSSSSSSSSSRAEVPEGRRPASCRIPKAAAVPKIRASETTPRPRPVTLIDDVHDRVSRDYLEEAQRILASGILDRDLE